MEYNKSEYQDNISNQSYNNIKQLIVSLKESCFSEGIDFSSLLSLANSLKNDSRKNIRDLACKTLADVDKRLMEIERVKRMYMFDKSYMKNGFLAGLDEVGRGPLAGPIVAAAVVLPLDFNSDRDLILGIKDSKKLSSKLREELSELIKAKAIDYSIAELESSEIDSKGIAWCNNEVFRMASGNLKQKPQILLSDGYPIKNIAIKNEFAIKGDEKSASIACASIIAKVYRDNLMKGYGKIYPDYGFEENMGYGTKHHIQALRTYGPCAIHRHSFLSNLL